MLFLSAPLCNMLAPLLDPSSTSTERHSSSAALFDPDRATRAFCKFRRRPTTPRRARTRVFEAWAASGKALRNPGALHAPASHSRTARQFSDRARARRRRCPLGAPLQASCVRGSSYAWRGGAASKRSPQGPENREYLQARQPIAMVHTQVPKGLGCRAVRRQNEAHAQSTVSSAVS